MKALILSFATTLICTFAFADQTANELPKVKGVVRLVDKVNSKLKVKHERIPNLDMPAMTMSFFVAEEISLEDLAPNDQILFTVDQIDGQYVIPWLEKQEE